MTHAHSIRLALPLCAALLATCAHQVAPGGGLPDTKPPKTTVSMPADGQTGVARNASVSVTFSEWIDPRTAQRSVTLYPPPAAGLRVRVKGRTLHVRPASPLADSTTYHLEVASGLKDLRGNTLGAPFHVVFSTGAGLDSGRISGCVLDPASRTLQPTVALLRVDSLWHDSLLFGAASYCAQTDSFGRFSLRHIRPGTYEVMAFVDASGDGRLQPGREKAYAATERRVTLAAGLDRQLLYPVGCDTTSRRVSSCSVVCGRLLAGVWSRPPAAATGERGAGLLAIERADSALPAPSIRRYVPLAGGSRFMLLLSTPLQLAPYRLICRLEPPLGRRAGSPAADTLRFNGVALADTSAAAMVSPRVMDKVDLQPRLALAWSEPVRLSGRLRLADTLGDTITLDVDTGFADTTVLLCPRRLLPGRSYRLAVPAGQVQDLLGRRASDTGMTVVLRTIAADSVCLRVAGRTDCPQPDSRRRWLFVPFSPRRPPALAADVQGSFSFDSLAGGLGRLAWFSDRNGNGRPDRGELVPWSPPEAYTPSFDTLEARPRWEVSGVNVAGCDPCERTSPPGRLGAPAPRAPSASGPAAATPGPRSDAKRSR